MLKWWAIKTMFLALERSLGAGWVVNIWAQHNKKWRVEMKKTGFVLGVVAIVLSLAVGQVRAQNMEGQVVRDHDARWFCPNDWYVFGTTGEGILWIVESRTIEWKSKPETSPLVVHGWLEILLKAPEMNNVIIVSYTTYDRTIDSIMTSPADKKMCKKK